jgi:hypothetical protein
VYGFVTGDRTEAGGVCVLVYVCIRTDLILTISAHWPLSGRQIFEDFRALRAQANFASNFGKSRFTPIVCTQTQGPRFSTLTVTLTGLSVRPQDAPGRALHFPLSTFHFNFRFPLSFHFPQDAGYLQVICRLFAGYSQVIRRLFAGYLHPRKQPMR